MDAARPADGFVLADGGVDVVDAAPPDAAPSECRSDEECRDEDPCTLDRCAEGRCSRSPVPEATPCPDADRCNGEEACNARGECERRSPATVCTPSGPCVDTACDPSTGACVESSRADCCGADADCAAGDCETARCDVATGQCSTRPVPGCCATAEACPAEVCQVPVCDDASSRCGAAPIPGCCVHDGDCATATACRVARCDLASNTCVEAPLEGCCVEDADCPAAGPCQVARCEAGRCVPEALSDCCDRDEDCRAPLACQRAVCEARACRVELARDCCVDADCPTGDRCTPDTFDCARRPVDYAAILEPTTAIATCPGLPDPSASVRVYVAGRTQEAGAEPGLDVAIGYGPLGRDPAQGEGWRFLPTRFQGEAPNAAGELTDDVFVGTLADLPAGPWDVAFRVVLDGGPPTYVDLPPGGSTDGYSTRDALHLDVQSPCRVDQDQDSSPADVDCDDDDPRRRPGGPEVCGDDLDGDCDAVPDAEEMVCAAPPAVERATLESPDADQTLCDEETPPVLYGRVHVPGRTDGLGAGPGVVGELGFGPAGARPDAVGAFAWRRGEFNRDVGEADELRAALPPLPVGAHDLAWRFRVDDGDFVYADLGPAGSTDGYSPADTLHLTVLSLDEPACSGPTVGYAALNFPRDPLRVCVGEDTPLIFGKLYVDGRTPAAGGDPGVGAALGYGPDGSDPRGPAWQFVNGEFNVQQLNDDEYKAVLSGLPVGEYDLTWRFRVDRGRPVYADLGPGGTLDGYDPATTLSLSVVECP